MQGTSMVLVFGNALYPIHHWTAAHHQVINPALEGFCLDNPYCIAALLSWRNSALTQSNRLAKVGCAIGKTGRPNNKIFTNARNIWKII